MTNYYYVGIALPPLSFESLPEIRFPDFDRLIKDNLTNHDYQKTELLRQLYDILNLRALWLEEELDPIGKLDASQLEEAVLNQTGLPSYIFDFLDKYEKVEERLHHFPLLLSQFFKQAAQESRGFLHEYLQFEREWRLVFTGFRAKKMGRDLSVELQYEDPEEPFIAQLLAQKDARTYEPPEKYQDLKILFDTYNDDPLALQRALNEYRFHSIENLIKMTDSFSIERILAYMAQLIIVEKWFQLDKQKGTEIIDTIVKETG
jgi:hypothetical protein